jgi:hypothetical protein
MFVNIVISRRELNRIIRKIIAMAAYRDQL